MITSTKNQQIKEIQQLQKKAKARLQQRVFVVEGPKMVWEAPRDWLIKIYVSESLLLQEEVQQGLRQRDCPYEAVSDAVFKAASDTQTPQGILALVRMPSYSLADCLNAEHPHLLVLENIQDPGNLGTMLRTGEGAGIDGVIITRNSADPFHPKTLRSTMGSVYRVPVFVSEDLNEDIQKLKSHGISLYAAHLKGRASYGEPDYTKGTAFLIGNEGNGLTEETASLADCLIRIPMEGSVESLNAAIAAALLMYEVHRQRH